MFLFDLLKPLRRGFARTPESIGRKRRPRRAALQCEALEERRVPAITYNAVAGLISIQGGSKNDVAEVRLDTRGTASALDDKVIASLRSYSAAGSLLSTETREFSMYGSIKGSRFLTLRVMQVNFTGSGGQDRFTNHTSVSSLADGGSGNDTLVGGSGADTLRGGFGHDSLRGLAGNDTLEGGYDHDTMSGGDGNDSLVGSYGNDSMLGGIGDDTMDGGFGDDVLRGEAGYDRLYGSFGNDVLFGGDNNDQLYGGFDNDGLFGGGGHDNLYGQFGADRFLLWNPTPSDLAISIVHDQAAEDAAIVFDDGRERVIEGVTYSAKSWTPAEIERMDWIFALLHRETGSTTLLERSDGQAMHFQRNGGTGRGWNYGDFMILTDAQLGGSDNWLHGYTLHEVGHNWNGDQIGATRWRDFRNLSWTSDDRIRSGAVFASDYARSSVNEDWSESFAAYFQQEAGEAFYNGAGAAAIPDKITLIRGWVDTV
jgi:Ca2+-binding RTX toxin-like protein